jgi:hypothetical protein
MTVQTNFSTPATATTAVYTLITALCAAGWVIPAWSDGTTLTTPGSPLATNPYGSAGSGATNLGNTSAWLRLTAPNGTREWLIQRGTTDVLWTISRSRTGFSGGSPSATVLPTDATTGQAMVANATFFPAVSSTHRWGISLENSAPYGWTAFLLPIGGGNVITMLFDEPLATASIAATDGDVVLFGSYFNATGFAAAAGFTVAAASTLTCWKRFRHGLASPSNVRVQYLGYYERGSAALVAPASGTSQCAVDPINSLEAPLPIQVAAIGNPATNTGYCGFLNRHRWCSVSGRSNGQTLYDATNGLYWIYLAGLWLSWDSSTPTI